MNSRCFNLSKPRIWLRIQRNGISQWFLLAMLLPGYNLFIFAKHALVAVVFLCLRAEFWLLLQSVLFKLLNWILIYILALRWVFSQTSFSWCRRPQYQLRHLHFMGHLIAHRTLLLHYHLLLIYRSSALCITLSQVPCICTKGLLVNVPRVN